MSVVALGVAGAVHAGIATYATELSDLRVEKERVETIEQGQTFSSFEIMRSFQFSRSCIVTICRLKRSSCQRELHTVLFFF